jgi:uncharacterized OsmC-like protein
MTQSTLSDYLEFKRTFLNDPNKPKPTGAPLTATVSAEGRAGIRRVKIRDHQIISDSGYKGGGSDLGPIPAEFVLAGLGGCLSHGWVMQSALAGIDLQFLEIDVQTTTAAEGSKAPVYLEYTVRIGSDASPEKIRELLAIVEQKSFVFNLLINPIAISGTTEEIVKTGQAA